MDAFCDIPTMNRATGLIKRGLQLWSEYYDAFHLSIRSAEQSPDSFTLMAIEGRGRVCCYSLSKRSLFRHV